jgi:hypothetical protein
LAISTKVNWVDLQINLDNTEQSLMAFASHYRPFGACTKFNNVKEYNNLGNPLQPLMGLFGLC